MSATTPSSTSRSRFAIGFLTLMFVAGLVLVYSVDTFRPATAIRRGENLSATSSMAAPVAASPDESSGSNADLKSTKKTESIRDPLPAIQQRIAALEEALKALKQDQAVAFEIERQRIATDLAGLEQGQPPDRKQAGTTVQPNQRSPALLQGDLAALNAQWTADGILVSLTESDLRFSPAATILPSERPAALLKVADFLATHPELKVLLRGYTDNVGRVAKNLTLSEQRAIAVKKALIDSLMLVKR